MRTLDGSELSTLRLLNENAVLEQLYSSGSELTVSALSLATRLSRPTVEAALVNLIARGWVAESEPVRAPRAGRPAKQYSFQARQGAVVGVDLGPHGLACALADLRGTVLHHAQHDDLDLAVTADAVDAVASAVHDAAHAAGIGDDVVTTITVALPAVIGRDGGIALTTVVPDWQRDDLLGLLRSRFPAAAVRLENDAKLATGAEMEYGAAAGVANAVTVLIGRRIAAGVIVDGTLTRGHHGSAGEIGALPAANWTTAHERLGADAAEIQHTIAAVQRGDDDARARFAEFARALAPGISALCLIVDPEVVVIGGSIAAVGDALIDPLREALCDDTLFPVEVTASTLGKEAVTLGAVAHGLDHVRRELLAISPDVRGAEAPVTSAPATTASPAAAQAPSPGR